GCSGLSRCSRFTSESPLVCPPAATANSTTARTIVKCVRRFIMSSIPRLPMVRCRETSWNGALRLADHVLHRLIVDGVPVQLDAKPRLLRDMDVPLVVKRPGRFHREAELVIGNEHLVVLA